ncbi:hypothetical protein BU23DRAFT_76490 [Bimuria novae-zelandiae CBS 107.79]|uniref:Uncharacterized protein n=1 Tax=Bimuria novae-zelandiae CBS 107.79 TaxID=1447943 RepID=A0A6A5VEQ5_9PLEO|nr:hypothetical protein BU23DRAFT_76490 [Bimuria novae-zelandiae CBS 107.79]
MRARLGWDVRRACVGTAHVWEYYKWWLKDFTTIMSYNVFCASSIMSSDIALGLNAARAFYIICLRTARAHAPVPCILTSQWFGSESLPVSQDANSKRTEVASPREYFGRHCSRGRETSSAVAVRGCTFPFRWGCQSAHQTCKAKPYIRGQGITMRRRLCRLSSRVLFVRGPRSSS